MVYLISVCVFLVIAVVLLVLVTARREDDRHSTYEHDTLKRRKQPDKSRYDRFGRNEKGQYNRMSDTDCFIRNEYSPDGFLNPRRYPVSLSRHAKARMGERMGVHNELKMYKLACDAYSYGKSSRQLKRSSAAVIEEIKEKHPEGIVLIYRNFLYIFSRDNELITIYKNSRVDL